MKKNVKAVNTNVTHEGAKAYSINPEQELRRSTLACMLWEDSFYENGVSIADRIASTVHLVDPFKVSQIAIDARSKFNLRHAPLLIARELARDTKAVSHRGLVSDTLYKVIQRADELAEFLSIYWLDKRQPLSAQVKKGLARAFTKFDAYQLAKYNRDNEIKLRDVLFLCHAKPKDELQANTWKQLVDGTLPIPNTWENRLSAGEDKRVVWESMLKNKELGTLALIRNLRNMESAGVDRNLVKSALLSAKTEKIFPFRFVAAAKASPKFEEELDAMMLKGLSQNKVGGKTVVVIDVSGSMYHSQVSSKSDMNRALAASALGAIAREMFTDVAVYATAGNDFTRIHKTSLVPNRHGMALVDAIYDMCSPLGGGGIFLKQVCDYIDKLETNVERMIVITDEQDCARDPNDSPLNAKPLGKYNYVINVGTYKNGIGYGRWTHIDGWSEAVLDYIVESERASIQ